MNKTITHSALALIALTSLSGFTDLFFKHDVYGDTKFKIKEIETSIKPSPDIEGFESKPLTPYVPYRFLGQGAAAFADDPFAVRLFVREVGQQPGAEEETCAGDEECGDGPPLPHTPYFLESYSLDQLTMTGSLAGAAKGKVALIRTPDSGIVYAAKGEYIGRNNGLILSINREGMIIQEKYRSNLGWEDRLATLPLNKN